MEDNINLQKFKKEIEDTEKRYLMVSELSGLLIYDYDVSSGEINWEGAIESMTGFTSEEYQKVNIDVWASMIHQEDYPRAIRSLENCIRNKSQYTETYRLKRKDGTYFFVQERGVVVDKNPDISTRMVGVIEDIHIRKLAEEALIASEKKFHLFYDITNEAMFYIDSETKQVLDANRKFFQLFGYEVDETGSIFAGNLFDEEYRERIFHWLLRDDKTSINIPAKRKDGTSFPALLRHHQVYYKGQDVIFISILDVSIYKEAEMLKQAYDSIRLKNKEIESKKLELEETLVTLKKTQNQLVFSEKMAALGQIVAGIAHEINNPIGAIKASGDILGDNLANIVYFNLDAISLLSELTEQQREKFLQWILVSSVNETMVYGTKLRERKKLLKELLKKEEAYEVDYLVENIIDYNMETNLAEFIYLFKALKWKPLVEYAFLMVSIFQNLRTIDNSINRVSKIIYALKNFSHINQEERMNRADIGKTIDLVLTIYQNMLKKGVTLQKEYEDAPEIFCFPDGLHQVWTNLIYNALQAMEFKGVLTIGLKNLNDYILISISDTGGGIPIEIREKIFEPFFTTKALGEGSGMGLGIVKKIIDMHNGKIELESSEKGTTFHIYLPKVLSSPQSI